jgi:hypothetical protein
MLKKVEKEERKKKGRWFGFGAPSDLHHWIFKHRPATTRITLLFETILLLLLLFFIPFLLFHRH